MSTKSRHMKMTTQRKVILEELERSHCHPTADELYEMVRKRLPRISLGTVYRNLEALSEAGLIRKLEFAGCQKRFDREVARHNHIRCIDCGRLEDLPALPADQLIEKYIPETDFEIIEYKLDFIGICPECQKKRKRKGV